MVSSSILRVSFLIFAVGLLITAAVPERWGYVAGAVSLVAALAWEGLGYLLDRRASRSAQGAPARS